MKCDIDPSVQRARATRPGSSSMSSRRSGLRASTTSPQFGGRERLEPPPRHFLVAPVAVGERVVAQHQVEVVAEHRVRIDVDREAGRQLPDALDEPGAAVGVVAAVVVVDAAQEGAADATRHEVVVALVDGIDQQMSRGCHAAMVRNPGTRRYRRIAMASVGNTGIGACEIG